MRLNWLEEGPPTVQHLTIARELLGVRREWTSKAHAADLPARSRLALGNLYLVYILSMFVLRSYS